MPSTQEWVPPDVLTALPLDGCGAVDGDCRLLEPLLDEFEVLPDELEEPDELDELEELEDPVLADPVLAAACEAPGSRTATTPAAAMLAIPAAAVVAVSRRRPRARSATARVTARDAAVRRAGYSGLLMSASLTNPVVGAVYVTSPDALILPLPTPGQAWLSRPGTAIMAG
jgi:hypothetical protein